MRSAVLAGVAIATLVVAGVARSQPAPASAGIDLRILSGGRVLARRGVPAGRGGDAVRLVSDTGVCDGTLGPDVDVSGGQEGESPSALAADVRGCARGNTLFAIVRPRPIASWPTARPPTDPRATEAIALARQAATTAGHLRGEVLWDLPRVYELGDALYVLVSGPTCPELDTLAPCSPSVAAVTRARTSSPPEVVMARPAHVLWTHEDLVESSFAWRGVTDVDGDGVVEVIETQSGDGAFMVRLVRVGARPAGDVVWLASYRDDPLDATVGRPPRPVPRAH